MAYRTILPLSAIGLFSIAGLSGLQSQPSKPVAGTPPSVSPAALPGGAGPGASGATVDPAIGIVKAKCTGCHGMGQVTMQRKAPKDWAQTVQVMINRGATLTVGEQKSVTDYLARTYPAN